MLDTHYPQITDKKLNDVEISLQEPISKINLRGKSKEFFAKAGKVLSLILPKTISGSFKNKSGSGFGKISFSCRSINA